MSDHEIVVEFNAGKGRARLGAPAGAGHKICFPPRGRAVSDGTWVCRLLKDTSPGLRGGALICAPIRQLRWDWFPGRETCAGITRLEYRCEDARITGLPLATLPADHWRDERIVNAAFHAAQELEAAWRDGRVSVIRAAYGDPEIVAGDGDEITLRWQRGDVRAPVEQALYDLERRDAVSPTGLSRVSGDRVYWQYALSGHTWWRETARAGEYMRHPRPEYGVVPDAAMLAALRSWAADPRTAARRDLREHLSRWGYSAPATLRHQVMTLESDEGWSLVQIRQKRTWATSESDDGMRPGRESTVMMWVWFLLHENGAKVEIGWGNPDLAEALEIARRRTRRQLDQAVELGTVPPWPPGGEEWLGSSQSSWEERYRMEWQVAADEWLRGADIDDVDPPRS